MATRGYSYHRYEYETSPRKLEPIREPKRKEKAPTRKISEKEQERLRIEKSKQKKIEAKKKIKLVAYLILGFSIVFAIGYRNSQINEVFSETKKIEKQISQVKKENEQLEVSIQNSLNLNQIEQLAKEKLGMQKLTSRQTIYIDLPKKDYVEAAVEEIVEEDNTNIFEKAIHFIKNLF